MKTFPVPSDLQQYLEINLFERLEDHYDGKMAVFSRPTIFAVRISMTAIKMDISIREKPNDWTHVHQVTGWKRISVFDMMLLLHVLDAVSLKDFAKVAKKDQRHADVSKLFRRNIDQLVHLTY